MCRFITYLGPPTRLERIVSESEHSLVVQSYQPQEMTSGVVNADGFGVGWYNPELESTPCVYTNTCPIWSDRNLPGLGHHIASSCIFANVRSATPGQAVDQSNCQPFAYRELLFMHNGFIENFRHTLMRPVRDALQDEYYTAIEGSTDSEHVFALLLQFLHGETYTRKNVQAAVQATLTQLMRWAEPKQTQLVLNLAVTNGEFVVAARFASSAPAPSLYYAVDTAEFPRATLIASERPFASDAWQTVAEDEILSCDTQLQLEHIVFHPREAVTRASGSSESAA
jgi:ergothioneine biosynthesis protein EgtC